MPPDIPEQHDGLLKSHLVGVDKDFSYWHRLASEGLVYVSAHPGEIQSFSRIDLAIVCEEKAKEVSINEIQVELAKGLIEAAKNMRNRLERKTDDDT